MNEINIDYGSMSDFNKYHVTPENKFFAVLNTLLAIIENHFPEVSILKEFEFKSLLTLEKLKEKLPDLDENYLIMELSRNVQIFLKAFPKDKENFSTELMLKFIEFVQNNNTSEEEKTKFIKEIKSNLDYPNISTDKMGEVFL
jgi:hypothetical protein